jgi:hypothetical protein
MKQVTYKTINIEEDAEAMQKVMSMTGRSIAPTTLVSSEDGKEEVIVGYNLSQLAASIQNI